MSVLKSIGLEKTFTIDFNSTKEEYVLDLQSLTLDSDFSFISYMTDFLHLFEQSSKLFKGQIDGSGFELRSKPRSWINNSTRYFGFKSVQGISIAKGNIDSENKTINVRISGMNYLTIFRLALSFIMLLLISLMSIQLLPFAIGAMIIFFVISYIQIRRSMKILELDLKTSTDGFTINWKEDDVL